MEKGNVHEEYLAFLRSTEEAYNELQSEMGSEFEPMMAEYTASIIQLQEGSKKPGGISYNIAAMILMQMASTGDELSEEIFIKLVKASMFYHALNRKKLNDVLNDLKP